MKTIRPRALKHRGVVSAAGFLFDTRLIGMAEARRRVLAVWSPGAQVYRIEDDLLIRLATPVLVRCITAPGLPLIETNGVLLAAPLADDELRALKPPAGSCVLVRGGASLTVTLASAMIEPPETWLDVESFNVIDTTSLGAAPARPQLIAAPLPPFDARKKLEGVPPPAPQMQSVLAALRAKSAPGGHPATTATAATSAQAVASGLLSRLASAIERLTSIARRFFSARTGRAARGSRSVSSPAAPVKPPLASKLSSALRKLAARLLAATRLRNLIGREQARYLLNMAEMFERGDLNEALRHAIPIDAKVAAALSAPALWVPRPRAGLDISPHSVAASSSIGLGNDWLSYLRKLYRASFERLEAQGRIEEAAFVLAELLHADEEAVAFLERHGRLELAAEMAEARDLPPGLVVRQWFIAGDRARAVSIARRTGAFADAVMRLERSDKQQAEILRLLWAAALAEAGDYAGAVDAAWPVAEARRLTRDWMDKAIELGGPVGARILARKISVAPEAFDETREGALALLDDESREGETARRAFAFALIKQEKTPESRSMARAAARALLRDAGRIEESALERLTTVQLRYLVDYAGDAALRADFPLIPKLTPRPLHSTDQPRRIRIEATDTGAMPASDAAFLADGRMVVALGEAGVKLLTKDGRTVAHFDQPAHRLVMSDNGDRAIAMAHRGYVWKLARIDFLSRKSSDWCEARIDAFAIDYDGAAWFIAADKDFYAIDATAKRFDALWRVPDVDASFDAVTRSATSCRFLVSHFGREEWVYQLPQMILRSRPNIPWQPEFQFCMKSCLAVSADGRIADLSIYLVGEPNTETQRSDATHLTGEVEKPRLRLYANGELYRTVLLEGDQIDPEVPVIVGNRVAAPYRTDEGMRVLLVDVNNINICADVLLAGANDVALRLTNDTLTIADTRGRVLVIDVHQGRVLRDLRV